MHTDSYRDNEDKNGDTAPSLSSSTRLTTHQVASILGVTPRTVRRWAASGKLAAERVHGERGDELRFSPAAVATCRLLTLNGDSDTDSHTDNGDTSPLESPSRLPTADELLPKALDREAALLADVARLTAELRRADGERDYLRERLVVVERDRDTSVADYRERLGAAEKAQDELRVLLLRSQELATALNARLEAVERPALTEGLATPVRPWWRFWG